MLYCTLYLLAWFEDKSSVIFIIVSIGKVFLLLASFKTFVFDFPHFKYAMPGGRFVGEGVFILMWCLLSFLDLWFAL